MKRVPAVVSFPISAENRAQRGHRLKAAAPGPGIGLEPVNLAPRHHVGASDMALSAPGLGLAPGRAASPPSPASCHDMLQAMAAAGARAG